MNTIIVIFIKSYLNILVSLGVFALIIFVTGIYFILRPVFTRKKSIDNEISHDDDAETPIRQPITITSQDIKAIAGDDVIATQLDLARAYLETGRDQLAKKILEYVVKQGNTKQRQEAQRLLNFV